MVNKTTNAANQAVLLHNRTARLQRRIFVPSASTQAFVDVPARKGDTVVCTYTAGGAINYFIFIYAEGQQSIIKY